jgi:actin-related protein
MALVLPPMLPLPLLSTILDTIFNNFQPPTISLLSAPVLTTVAAGLRAALVVDIGWAETVVTGIYEYREVLSHRTIRASKLLSSEMLKFLGKALLSVIKQAPENTTDMDEKGYRKIINFEECEEIVARMAWCRPLSKKLAIPKGPEALSYVEEEELDTAMQGLNLSGKDLVSIPLNSTQPPVTLRLPFCSLSKPCEDALFADGIKTVELDDEELPLHLLVYRTLLHLPVDVRSVCMSRIVFTGAASNMPGLKNRIIDEVDSLLQERGWDPVQGTVLEELRNNEKTRTHRSKQASGGPTEVAVDEQVRRRSSTNPAVDEPEPNPYEDKLRRELNKGARPPVQGTLRALESMGPWSGGSLLSQLKIPAVSIVEREQWLQHGVSGATKQGEITSTDQRQSMGPGGLRAGQVERLSWTLGPWG